MLISQYFDGFVQRRFRFNCFETPPARTSSLLVRRAKGLLKMPSALHRFLIQSRHLLFEVNDTYSLAFKEEIAVPDHVSRPHRP